MQKKFAKSRIDCYCTLLAGRLERLQIQGEEGIFYRGVKNVHCSSTTDSVLSPSFLVGAIRQS